MFLQFWRFLYNKTYFLLNRRGMYSNINYTESIEPMNSIFFASVLSLCAAPLWGQDQVTLLLDWFVNPDHGPVIIAQERGYFAEQDLMVEVIAPADPSAPPKMVAAGQAFTTAAIQGSWP